MSRARGGQSEPHGDEDAEEDTPGARRGRKGTGGKGKGKGKGKGAKIVTKTQKLLLVDGRGEEPFTVYLFNWGQALKRMPNQYVRISELELGDFGLTARTFEQRVRPAVTPQLAAGLLRNARDPHALVADAMDMQDNTENEVVVVANAQVGDTRYDSNGLPYAKVSYVTTAGMRGYVMCWGRKSEDITKGKRSTGTGHDADVLVAHGNAYWSRDKWGNYRAVPEVSFGERHPIGWLSWVE